MSTSHVDGGTWLVRPERELTQRLDSLEGTAFIGVDFGTSTTVVSLVGRDDSERSIAVRPLTLSQPSLHGGVVRDEIVNTVLAFRNDTLLFGRDAYNLRSRLTEGRNTFSSFKMGLGLDLGPEFGATALPAGRVPGITIERPADAAREFFKLLMRAVHDELGQLGLTRGARFAFSVPAAFQANQRRDLMAAIRGCGIEVDESCLIDEPNAAFLSYVHEVARSPDGQDLLVRAKDGQINAYTKGFDPGATAQKHRETAAAIWPIRESYLSLLTDTVGGQSDLDTIRKTRDQLQGKLATIYHSAPHTDGKAYADAQDALKAREDYTFSIEEIDHFLPAALRLGPRISPPQAKTEADEDKP